jgi:hypothetical protein
MKKTILENLTHNGFTFNIEIDSLCICGEISLNDITRTFYLTDKDFTLIEWVYDHHTGIENEVILLEVLTDDVDLVCAMTKEIFDDIYNEIKGEELYLESLMKGNE